MESPKHAVSSQETVRSPILRTSENGSKTNECDWCGSVFLNLSVLQKHFRDTYPGYTKVSTEVYPKEPLKVCKRRTDNQLVAALNSMLRSKVHTEGKSEAKSEEGNNPKDFSHDEGPSEGASSGPTIEDDQTYRESKREDDDPKHLASSHNHDVANELQSSSMPRTSFMSSNSLFHSPLPSLGSLTRGHWDITSPESYHTALSSLASYATPSSIPGLGTSLSSISNNSRYVRGYTTSHYYHSEVQPTTTIAAAIQFPDLVQKVVEQTLLLDRYASEPISITDQAQFKSWVHDCLVVIHATENAPPQTVPRTDELVTRILGFRAENRRSTIGLEDAVEREDLAKVITALILEFQSTQTPTHSDTAGHVRKAPIKVIDAPGQVFSSEWLSHLHSRGILLDPKEELNWSGRGQHVEYEAKDANQIPLIPEDILGHSAFAIVESVRCLRIRLARKKIVCNRRLRKEDLIQEVEYLQKLQHTHIVRIVGTYTLKKTLAILLYPAAKWNLDEYMEEILDSGSSLSYPVYLSSAWSQTSHIYPLIKFFGCLSNAVNFVHERNVKHMDIKPKNILVRPHGDSSHKLYLADFGIARAYKSAEESFTDSPTSFTRAYAAPEVVAQDARGFSADVFSLGCVFVEMMATLSSTSETNYRQALMELRGQSGEASYSASIDRVVDWYATKILNTDTTLYTGLPWVFINTIPKMIQRGPDSRPSILVLKAMTNMLCNAGCGVGPEPFEAAEPTSSK